jgi:preprotein translocase subunit SecG
LIYVVYVLHVITCIFLILVVLLQQGKGADLSVFGGGSTQAAFGARGAATLLHKLTVAFFVLFMITTISIGVLQRGRRTSSVMQGVANTKQEPAAPAPAAPQPPAAQSSAPASGTESQAPAAAPAEQAPAAPPQGGNQPSSDAQPQQN